MVRFHSNKRAIIQFGIIAIALAVVIVGFLAFNPFKAEAQEDFTTPKRPQTTTISNKEGLKGFLTEVKILDKDRKESVIFKVGEPLKVVGKFNVQSEGDYYIEFGIPKSSRKELTILKSSQSACDGARNYAGVWFNNARNGDVQEFELTITDITETGTYDLGGGVYSRCGVGADIASISTTNVKFLSSNPITSTPPPTNSINNPITPTTPSVCTPSGYFSQLWVRKLGMPTNADNGEPRVVGIFKNNANCRVTYYIEAGMLESSFKPLSIRPFFGDESGWSASCGTEGINPHFSGAKITFEAGESKSFRLNPTHYGKDGRYTVQGGVFYNGGNFCGNADIASFKEQEVVFAGFGQSAIDSSWERII